MRNETRSCPDTLGVLSDETSDTALISVDCELGVCTTRECNGEYTLSIGDVGCASLSCSSVVEGVASNYESELSGTEF